MDTDVLIWYAKRNQNAVDLLHASEGLSISVITYMEIVQGARNKRELNAFKKALSVLKVSVLQINDVVSTKAMFFVEQYALSHAMELADALIGATSIIYQQPLLTGNEKHYKYLPEMHISKFVPA